MMVEEQKAEIAATKTERGLITINIKNSEGYEGYANIEIVFSP